MKARGKTTASIILAVIAAGGGLAAQETPLPWTYFADGASAAGASAGGAPGGAASSTATQSSSRFLGFKDKEGFHRFSGWMSGGLLLASGLVGAAHAYGMMEAAHEYRDSLGMGEEFNSALCRAKIAVVYNDPAQQALRWTHVGLLAAGESFYLANAITGTDFMGSLPPGWSKARIHRYAFFFHAGLMAAEGVLGFLSTDALRRGDHETFTGLLVAHAGLGIVIPLTILGAGAIMGPRQSP